MEDRWFKSFRIPLVEFTEKAPTMPAPSFTAYKNLRSGVSARKEGSPKLAAAALVPKDAVPRLSVDCQIAPE